MNKPTLAPLSGDIENASLFARGVTPLPNVFFDHWMPQLNDTQWRLLCVIGRATLGWREKGKTATRRRRDWLSHSQLQRRTGRTSSAVSGAIDRLVRQNLIQVFDGQGQVLLTPAERRRCRSKLFYQLTEVAMTPLRGEKGAGR